MQQKILVGCPTSFHKEYCLKEYAEAINKLTYKNHDVLLVDNDYLLSLEQDVIPPKDIIERLLQHKKEVITAVYFANNIIPGEVSSKLIPLVYVLEDQKTISMRSLNEDELWKNQGLMQVISAGLGCILIHKNILKKIKFRYELNTFDDRWFFMDLYNKKIPVYADTSIKCKHLIYNRPYPWSKIKK